MTHNVNEHTCGHMAHRLLMHRVIMRTLLALSLFAAACTANLPSGSESFDSMKERLQAAPARLVISGAESTGSVTARRWAQGGWIEGDEVLTIDSGELQARVNAAGQLALDAFEVAVKPIAIPEEVFGKPAELSDVKVKLLEATSGAVTWDNDNDATARLTLALDLEWAISVNGGTTPLGEQHLPPVEVDFTLHGDGGYVGATIRLAAAGELWNWAGLLKMTKLELTLGAATAE